MGRAHRADVGTGEGDPPPTRLRRVARRLISLAVAAGVWVATLSGSYEGWRLSVIVFAVLLLLAIAITRRTYRPSLDQSMKREISPKWAHGLLAGCAITLITLTPVWWAQYRHDAQLSAAIDVACDLSPPPGTSVIDCGGGFGRYQLSSEGFLQPNRESRCSFYVWADLEGGASEAQTDAHYLPAMIDRARAAEASAPSFRFGGSYSYKDFYGRRTTEVYFDGVFESGLDVRC